VGGGGAGRRAGALFLDLGKARGFFIRGPRGTQGKVYSSKGDDGSCREPLYLISSFVVSILALRVRVGGGKTLGAERGTGWARLGLF
jgi:hypothetical protein